MRVLVSARWLGGAGGTERAVHAVLNALQGEDVTLVMESFLGGDWSAVPASTRIYFANEHRKPISLSRGQEGNVCRSWSDADVGDLGDFDLHIAYFHGPDVTSETTAKLRLVVPCGNDASHFLDRYHVIALEAPDNKLHQSRNTPQVLLPPPLLPLPAPRMPHTEIPHGFFLTIFNPYNPVVKGVDDLLRAAENAPLPIVWCHSERTLKFVIDDSLAKHPNIIHIDDPAASEMRYLYECCVAYLNFSRQEGFGWASADALRYSRQIVTRRIGVYTFPQAKRSGVHITRKNWRARWSVLQQQGPPHREEELDWLSPHAYRAALRNLLEQRDRYCA